VDELARAINELASAIASSPFFEAGEEPAPDNGHPDTEGSEGHPAGEAHASGDGTWAQILDMDHSTGASEAHLAPEAHAPEAAHALHEEPWTAEADLDHDGHAGLAEFHGMDHGPAESWLPD